MEILEGFLTFSHFPFSSRSEFQLHYCILWMNVTHSTSFKLNDLQCFWSLCCMGSCSMSHWEGGFWIRCPCAVNTSRNQSLLVPSCVKMPSCFQFPSERCTFDSFHTKKKKNPNVGVSCGILVPAELLTCAPALAFTANVIPPSLMII